MKHSPILMLWIAIASIFSGACKKSFLDTPPVTSVETSQFIGNLRLDACSQLLNGAYQESGQNFFHGLNIAYSDLVSDNLKPVSTALNQQYGWNQVPSDATPARVPALTTTDMTPLWLSGYHLLRDVALVLENVDRFRSDDASRADSLKGQALALRALIHWYLVNVFAQPYRFTSDASHAGVPYVTQSDYTISVARATVATVYANIIGDLQEAIRLLPAAIGSRVFLNGTAARALLARVYLYKGDYPAAKQYAEAVLAAVPLMATGYPAKLFTNQETEALFQLPPSATGVSGGTYATNFLGIYLAPGSSQAFYATADMAALVKERPADARNAWFTAQGTNWRVSKYPTGVVSGFTNSAGAYFHTLLRASESCLIAAEASARGGNEADAVLYLDRIRRRADPTAPATTATGAALLDSIAKEKRKELCFEGLRMFELLRNGSGVNRADAANPNAVTLPYPADKAIAPVPLRDVRTLGYAQNKGY